MPLWLNELSIQISMALYTGMLLNKETTSRLAIYKLASCLQISSEKWNDSVTVCLFSAEGVKSGSKRFC